MISLRIALASVALLAAAASSSHAQSYPSRTITLVVPFPAGGGNDALARLVAERMSKTLGQQVVVENPVGAGGTVATRAIAKGAADGYTILLTYTGTLAINPSLYPNAGYDPRPDHVQQSQSGKGQLRIRARHSRAHLDRDVCTDRRHQAHQHSLSRQR